MFFKLWKRPRPAQTAAEALYAGAVAQARQPALYGDLGVPDTREGRFELYSLHVILLLDRLKAQGDQAAETAQFLVDRYTRGLDDAFREMGIGDLAVSKRMKKLAEAFYGRVRAMDQAFDALPEQHSLEALVERTLFEGDPVSARALCGYILQTRSSLAEQPLVSFLSGSVTWPKI
jgi:cytochrome b pre-mRNA-processing protein 3